MKSYENQWVKPNRRMRAVRGQSLIFAANFLFRETMQPTTCSDYAAAQAASPLFDPVGRICESGRYGE